MDAERLSRLRTSVSKPDHRPFGITHPYVVRVNQYDTDTAPMRFSNFACAARVVMMTGVDSFVHDEINNQASDYFKCCKHMAAFKWTHPDVM